MILLVEDVYIKVDWMIRSCVSLSLVLLSTIEMKNKQIRIK